MALVKFNQISCEGVQMSGEAKKKSHTLIKLNVNYLLKYCM